MHFGKLFLPAAALCLGLATTAEAAKPQRPPTTWTPPPKADPYEMVLLPKLGGAWSWSEGLSENGDVVGTADIADGQYHAVLWANAAAAPQPFDLHAEAVALGHPAVVSGGWMLVSARAANMNRQVVGMMKKQSPDGELHQLFRYTPGSATTTGISQLEVLPVPPGTATHSLGVDAINSSGVAVGWVLVDGVRRAIVWWDGPDGLAYTDLSAKVGTGSVAYDINDQGQISGQNVRAWRYSPGPTFFQSPLGGTFLDLGTFGTRKDPDSQALGVNASGQASGESYGKTFRFTDGVGLVDLGNLGASDRGPNVGGNINDRGDVVGTAVTYTDFAAGIVARHVFLYDGEQNVMKDVTAAITNLDAVRALGYDDPHILLDDRIMVNGDRQISGGTGGAAGTQAYLLVPVTSP